MSREIWFRAWDKAHNHMNGWDEVKRWSFKSYEDDNIVLLQYTGLKDKNGTEIYEGDIVMLPYITPLGQIQWNDIKEPEKYRHEIVFSHGSFSIKKPHYNEPLRDWCKSEEGEYIANYGNKKIIKDEVECEVIGNKYENAELL